MSEELKSCPFCGQQDAFVEQLDSDASVVICQGMVDEHCACLARGPVGVQQSELEDQPGRDAAIEAWNSRAKPAEAEGIDVIGYMDGDYRRDQPSIYIPHVRIVKSCAKGEALMTVTQHLAALSAVTAERGALKHALDVKEEFYQDALHSHIVLARQVNQLRAEVEALRKDAERLEFVENHWFYEEESGRWTFMYGEDWNKPGLTFRDAIDAARAAMDAKEE
ncbi:Lar family restriction alleviation protein [Pelagibacterium sp.]|uniref:Lar family restriction alleviation protein n=1 Tax=Pelagibacterium sp. TaxID=1967288 RepID=UPI003A920B54